MKNTKTKLIGALAAVVLMTVGAPNAFTGTTATTLTASVVDQQCQGGDGVSVTLTASLNPPRSGVTYAWDFDNDGVFDTVPSTDPTVTTLYPDEVTATATVAVMRRGRTKGTDSVTFQTFRCP